MSHRQQKRERKNLLRKRKRELRRKLLLRPKLRAEYRFHAAFLRSGMLDKGATKHAHERLDYLAARLDEPTATAIRRMLERVRSAAERTVLHRMLQARSS